MRHLRHFERFGAALLAVLMVMAGAPASACVAMPDCPMTVPAPAEHCHGGLPAGDEGVLPPPSLQAGADCCAALAAQPTVPAAAPASPAAALADLPAAADGSLAASEAHPPAPRAAPPLSRAAGRALLSLEQTFLI